MARILPAVPNKREDCLTTGGNTPELAAARSDLRIRRLSEGDRAWKRNYVCPKLAHEAIASVRKPAMDKHVLISCLLFLVLKAACRSYVGYMFPTVDNGGKGECAFRLMRFTTSLGLPRLRHKLLSLRMVSDL